MLVLKRKSIVLVVVITAAFILLMMELLSDKGLDGSISSRVYDNSNHPVQSDSIQNKEVFDKRSLLVQFNKAFNQLTVLEQQNIVSELGGKLEQIYANINHISLISLNSGVSHINDLISKFSASEWVEFAEPNYIVSTDSSSERNIDGLSWGLHNVGQSGGRVDADIDAPEAWDKYLKQGVSPKKTVIVAVLDSGIDAGHEVFKDKLWGNDSQIGFNACEPQQAITDTYGHGTQVASVITTVNPHTPLKILPVKVLCNGSQGNYAHVIAGLDYVLGLKKQGINISAINMSWGGENYSRILESALIAAAASDVVLVASAGNQSKNIDQHSHYPASYKIENLVVAAASNDKDQLLENSNYGSANVDLLAPGNKVLTASIEGGYQSVSGTSIAAAHVTGTVALLRSFSPDISATKTKAAILSNVDKTNYSDKPLLLVTKGRLNASEALAYSREDFAPTYIAELNSPSGHEYEAIVSLTEAAHTDSSNAQQKLTEVDELEVDIVPNHIMMRFTEAYRGLSKEDRQALLSTFDVTIVKDYPYAGGSALLEINGAPTAEAGKLPKGETKESVYQRVDSIIEQLTNSGLVDYAEPDYVVQTSLAPNDPRYSELWGLQTIQVEQAIDQVAVINSQPQEIIVGVIDTGIDYTHPDLAANMWVNPGEIAGNGIDDDGNGYIDDVHGWDAINNDGDPMDDNRHGTHVAGTIGAVRDNNEGIVGVTPYVKIMALKFLGANGGGSNSNAVELLNYVHLMKQNHGVDIRLTNNSWGGGAFAQALHDAISASNDLGILFVAAAGNSGRNVDNIPHYPSSYELDHIIAVAATDINDNLASFSNYGSVGVDIAAPGVGILSTTLGHNYVELNGTSMAAPHVSGAISLLLSMEPSLDNAGAKERILAGGDVLSNLSGRVATSIRLNANNTLPALIFEVDTLGNEPFMIPEEGTVNFNVRLRNGVGVGQTIISHITRVAGDSDITITQPSTATLTFDDSNRDQWQTVTFSAANDADGINHSAVFSVNAEGWSPVNLKVIEQDDDDPADICLTVSDVPESECRALVAFYVSTNGGTDWSNSDNWFNNLACTWLGVTCENGRVTRLVFLGNNLTGNLPAELENLPELELINLLGNNISGSIPSELGSLTNLHFLNLQVNQLTSSIPAELGNLINLEYLILNRNQLTGPIPAELGNLSQAIYFYLQDNQLSGNIPATLSGLLSAERFFLHGNQLTGSIPSELGNLPAVRSMALSSNPLTGSIPPELGNLPAIESLQIHGTQVSGSIPAELGNLSTLKTLGLQNNQLSGTIPPELGNLDSLLKLQFYNNQLTGSIPPELGNLDNLDEIIAYDNQLSGSIPPELANIPTLRRIWLYNNQLSGAIPAEFGSVEPLYQVILFNNQLSGSIPPELANADNLFELDLTGNQLTGSIPSEFGGLANLRALRLDNNRLTGSIPAELGNLVDIFNLNLANNRLSGSIPDTLGNLTELTRPYWPLDLRGNQLSGDIPSSLLQLENTEIFVDYNALMASDSEVESFIEGKNPGWQNNQTVVPDNISLSLQNDQLVLVWVPRGNSNEYIVSYSDNRDGPYVEHGRTVNGEVSSYVIADASQHPERFYVIQSYTQAHAGNQSDLISSYSYPYKLNVDTIPPELTVPASIAVEAEGSYGVYQSHSAVTAFLNNATAVDSVDGVISNISHNAQSSLPVGTTEITFTACDNLVNCISAVSYITVQDTTAPTITVAEDVIAEATALTTSVDLGVTTAADLVDGNVLVTPDVIGPFVLGTHTITWRAVDNADNEATATQLVTVQDTTAPVLTVPDDIYIVSDLGQSINIGVATATDIFSVEVNHDAPTVFPLGRTEVTWTAIDENGNQASAIQTIDILKPAVIFNPVNGSDLLSDTLELQWDNVNADEYSVEVGSTLGGNDLFSSSAGANTSIAINGLPTNGNAIYVRLSTRLGNQIEYTDTIYNSSGVCSNVSSIPIDECEALVQLYLNTDGSNWINNTGWFQGDPCGWYGITCFNSYVSSIFLPNNGLRGELPNEIGNFTALEALVLSNNELSGQIPSYIGSYSNLTELSLYANEFTGVIPESLGNLIYLKELLLQDNNLNGSIPESIGNLLNLQQLRLSNNRLSGSIPESLGNLTSLSSFSFSNNQLSGEVPASIVTLSGLQHLDILYNGLKASAAEVRVFLDSKQINNAINSWESTQTITPDNIEISLDEQQLVLSWTPISYIEGGGEYIISYSDNRDGPYIEHGRTANKSISTYSINDALSNPVRFYFLQTYTPASGQQQNDIISEYSSPIFFDETPPTITPPSNILLDATGELTPVNLGVATVTDNSGEELTAAPDNTGPFTVGEHTITWSATDSAGNTGTATQMVTIIGDGVWVDCASEYQNCIVPIPSWVRYGSGDQYGYRQVESLIACTSSRFDPLEPTSGRRCAYRLSSTEDFDGDGVVDSQDALPNDSTETMDSDGDGVGDNIDPFLNDPDNNVNGNWQYCANEFGVCTVPVPALVRYGLDGEYSYKHVEGSVECKNHVFGNPINVRKRCDYLLSSTRDSDGDGVVDSLDAFPADPLETADTDGDGFADGIDPFPNDPDNNANGNWIHCVQEWGYCTLPVPALVRYGLNGKYVYQQRDMETFYCGNSVFGDPDPSVRKDCYYLLSDTDDYDDDGVADSEDAFPTDDSESVDTDGDGIGDNADVFPNDSTNGVGDAGWVWCSNEFGSCTTPIPTVVRFGDDQTYAYQAVEAGTEIACRTVVFGEILPTVLKHCDYYLSDQTDFDGDGVMDRADAFPADSSEAIDSDGDGIGDSSDPFPLDPNNRAIANNNPWVACANEFASCQVPSIATIRYGANGEFVVKEGITGSVSCTNSAFGNDPTPGVPKTCEYRLESQTMTDTLTTISEDSQYNGGNPQRIRSELVGSPSYMLLSPARKTLDGTDVSIDYMVHEPVAEPKGLIVLIADNEFDAELTIDVNDNIIFAGNDFLVRSAHLFAAQGYKVITMDQPSDMVGVESYLYFHHRNSMRHVVDISTVINMESEGGLLPVFISGTGWGTVSAMAANSLADAVDLYSPVTYLLPLPYELAVKNAHVSWHVNSVCSEATPQMAGSYLADLIDAGVRVQGNAVDGGFNHPSQTDFCQPDTLHGFFGIESGVVEKTAQWYDSLLVRFVEDRPTADPVTLVAGTTTVDLAVLTEGEGDLSYSLPFAVSSLGGSLSLDNGVVTYAPLSNTVSTEDSFVYVVRDTNGRVNHNVVKIELQ